MKYLGLVFEVFSSKWELLVPECMYSILFHGYDIITGTAAAHDAP